MVFRWKSLSTPIPIFLIEIENGKITMMKYIQPTSPENAVGLVADVYAQMKRDFGRIVEPFTLHSPVPTLLAGTWMACRETELVGEVSRTVKEAVAAAVSILNQCAFCVDAHTVMLNSTGDHSIADALGNAHYERISDSKTRAIVDWALASRSPGNKILRSPPFSSEEAPEIIGTAVFYHYINRMATIFLGETPLPSSNPWLKDPLKRVAGLMFHKAVHRWKTPGESLEFLPQADLPEDMGWAKSNPLVAQAFARFAGTIQDLGETVLSQDARELILRVIDIWNGEEMQVRRKIDVKSEQFEGAQKSAVQLSLLAALAPHQMTGEDVFSFRKHFPYVTSLLGATAWASFIAARKIGTWIQLAS